ncbi:preprotein translocase subunit SecA, partial [Mycobacterium marinum]
GDPGESRFYLSLGDELMRRFNGAALESLLTRLNLPDDVPIEAKMVTRAIKSAQTQVEQQNFEVRKNVLKYDEVMNQQRKVIYAERRRILEGENLQQQAKDMLTDVITAYVDGATVEGYAEDWDLDALWTALKTLYPVGIKTDTLMRRDQDSDRDDLTRDELLEALLQDADQAYAAREAELEELAGEGAMRQLERNVLLNVIDRKWREHLYEMDYLKEGIGLRAMAQRDPLVEYQREGYDMFMAMLDGMKEESVGFLFNVSVEAVPAQQVEVAPVAEPEDLAEFATAAAAAAQEGGAGPKTAAAREEAPSRLRAKGIEDESPALTYSGPSEDGSAQVQRNGGGAAKTPAGVPAGGSRRERREAARRQGRGAKPPKSVKKR